MLVYQRGLYSVYANDKDGLATYTVYENDLELAILFKLDKAIALLDTLVCRRINGDEVVILLRGIKTLKDRINGEACGMAHIESYNNLVDCLLDVLFQQHGYDMSIKSNNQKRRVGDENK